MNTIMDDSQLQTMEQVRAFPEGVTAVEMAISSKAELYGWVRKTLVRFEYLTLGKTDRGLLLRYVRQVSGYSRAQVNRLAKQYRETGVVERRQCTTNGFACKYTAKDVQLLAQLDELHGTPSGPAAKKLCERAWHLYHQAEYENLAGISVSDLYNLRHSAGYVRNRRHFEKTRPTVSKIGERRRPSPNGKPGYLRVDTVHQGDLDGEKGIFHINIIDEVTQFEIAGSVEAISEPHLIPLLELLLEQFPFVIHGFHSDNGSEYVNRRVARLLNKLLIEFTKSRPRHSNDNALAEAKNGAVLRKHLGYSHIPRKYATEVNEFLHDYLNPYVNFHRPCFFPETYTDSKGKQRKRYLYAGMMTPYNKLRSLPDAEAHLKEGTTFQQLDDIATSMSDNEAARRLNQARDRLFQAISGRARRVA